MPLFTTVDIPTVVKYGLKKIKSESVEAEILTHDQCSFSSRLKFLIMGEDATFNDG